MAGLRGVGFTLIPVALLLTDTLQMVTRIGDAVGDWAVQPGLQPGDLARDHPGRASR